MNEKEGVDVMAFRYLFLTPSWGSKRRAAQREYEERLDASKKV